MRPHHVWIAGILAILCVPAFPSSGPSPAASQGSNEKVIYTFKGTPDGAGPYSDLILDGEGNLYGTTAGGGAYGYGTVFELKAAANRWTEEVLYSFTGGKDGAEPKAGVIFDNAGSLFGTTSGNETLCGNVFRLEPNAQGGWTEMTLYTFTCGDDGALPETDLVFDAKGNLFGATAGGSRGCGRTCGSVFELVPQNKNSWKEVTIHTFLGKGDGAVPSSSVLLDASGNLLGTTTAGGTGTCEYYRFNGGCGIVYELTPTTAGKWTETVVYNFTRGGGRAVTPSGGFIIQNESQIFATSVAGGDGIGAAFELKKSQKGWEQESLYAFYGSPDGQKPIGQLETNSSGALVGVTYEGGEKGLGTVFELNPSRANGWREKVLHSFAGGNDGASPSAGVVSDSQGHIYGTTGGGGNGTACGNSGCGTVYEITLGGQER